MSEPVPGAARATAPASVRPQRNVLATKQAGAAGRSLANISSRLPRPDSSPRLPAAPAAIAKPLRVVIVILVLAVCALSGWLIGQPGSAARHHPARHASSAPASVPAGPTSHIQSLTPVRAATFDPYGSGQDSQLARLAIDASPSTAWHTDWYTTAKFGNLKPGTGLLIDMGREVTITSARINLGRAAGADLQLRVGATRASLASLHRVARVTDASGKVRLRLAKPARGRYVLIWFTTLPHNASGTFEASVYNVRLAGLR